MCSDDAFKLLGGAPLFGQLALSSDPFVCDLSSHFLIELLKKKDHEQYLARLAKLVGRAQLDDDDEMLTNRFVRLLCMRAASSRLFCSALQFRALLAIDSNMI
jgi:hypothetical protein